MGNKLSVIVHATQQSLSLSRCLSALATQKMTTDDLEIVVVDPHCRRSLHQLVRWWNLTLARQGRRTRMVHVPQRNGADVERGGLRASSGSLIAFLDETSILPTDWALRAVDDLLLRESYPPDITPQPLARGMVQRRAFVTALLNVDERAVSSSGLSPRQEVSGTRGRTQTRERGTVVPLFENPRRHRFASAGNYIALAALFLTIAMFLLHQNAVAATSALTFTIVIVAIARRHRRAARRGGVVCPFVRALRTSTLRTDS